MGKWTRRAMLVGLGATGGLYACSTPATQFVTAVETKYPPIGEFVDAPDPETGTITRIHYDKRGSGPAVVMIHGASGNLRDFTFSMSDALAAKGFTAIAVDRPGFGYSGRPAGDSFTPSAQAATLRAAVAALGIERPIVMGHSFGGAVAAAWAVDAPDSIAGAVIISGVTYPWPAGDNLYHAAASTSLFGPPINAMIRSRVLSKGAGGAVTWVFQPQTPPEGYAEYVGAELASRPATFRENGRDITNVNEAMAALSPRYPGLTVPVELIHGTADEIVPIAEHARLFKANALQANLTELPGFGHMIHHAAEADVIAAAQRIAARAGS